MSVMTENTLAGSGGLLRCANNALMDYEPVIRSGHYLVHHSGLEPETDSLEGYCSLQLSLWRI